MSQKGGDALSIGLILPITLVSFATGVYAGVYTVGDFIVNGPQYHQIATGAISAGSLKITYHTLLG